MEKDMASIADHTGVKALIVKCCIFAFAGFIVFNVLFSAATLQSASNALKNLASEFENVIVPNENYRNEMILVSETLSTAFKSDKNITDEEIAIKVRESSKLLRDDTYVTETTNVIRERIDKYQNAYFKWYFEIISILGGVLCFFIPQWFLKFKAKTAQMNKEDEVNSFNSIVLTFMNMDGIQVETVLSWMERFSYYYRSAITDCIVNIEMGQQKALEKLKESDDLFDFRKFVTCLINVDQVGLKEAFADIEIQQDYYNEKRQVDNQKLIKKKSRLGARLAFIPMWITIGGYLMLPIALYAVEMFGEFSKTVQTLS